MHVGWLFSQPSNPNALNHPVAFRDAFGGDEREVGVDFTSVSPAKLYSPFMKFYPFIRNDQLQDALQTIFSAALGGSD